jgi:hypothetical protein
MISIVKYETEEEKQAIINSQAAEGFALTDIANITEGNFLGFDDTSSQQIIGDTTSEKLTDIQNSIDLLLLKQEGII